MAELEARAKALQEASDSASGGTATFSTDLDDAGLREKVIDAVRAAERNIAVIVGIDLDDPGLREKVIEAVRAAEKGINVIVGIDADAEGLRERVKAEADAAGAGVKVPLDADASKLKQDVKQKTEGVKPDPIDVPVKTDTAEFEQQFKAAMDEGAKAVANAEQAMRQSFTAMESGSRALRADIANTASGLDDAGHVVEDMQRKADEAAKKLEEAGNKAKAAGDSANSGGIGFGFLTSKASLLTQAALVLGPALAAIPAVVGAAGAGFATMGLALSGPIAALRDYGAQSQATGQSSAQLAATAFSNAVAIRNAEQAIADAKRQAAISAINSAQSIQSAEQGVTDAERQAAIAAQSAADAVASADQRLANAQQALQVAQQSLTQAQKDGVNVLKDLNLASADAANSVADAQNAVVDAQDAYDKAQGNSLLTAQQKKEAQQALIDAQQHLTDAQQKALEAQQAADDANQKGIDGSTAVVAAQQQVVSATQSVSDAQLAATRARQAQANQEISSNESIAKAQQSLTTAVRDAADQQVSSNESVSKAVQSLKDMQEQQALSAAAAASSGSAAADKFAQDMAKLTPAGRDFVNQLISMRGGLHDLESTAQTTVLPGFTTFLKDVGGPNGLGPIFNKTISDMGTTIGGTAVQFGNLMTSPAFKGELTQVLKDGAGFANDLASGLVNLTGGLTQAASNAGPIVSGLGQGIKTLMTSGIPEFFQGLVSNASGAGSALQGIVTIVSNLAGPLGTVASGLSAALAPAIQVLASPQVQQSLQSIATSIAQILIALSPVVTMLAQGLASALQIVAPLLQSVAKYIQDNATWLVPLAKAITIATIAWWGFNAALAANPLILIATLVTTLALALIYCYGRFQWFRDFVNAWWPELLAPFTGGVSEIIGHWNLVKNFFAVDIPRFFNDLLKFVENWWPELLVPFTGGVSEIIAHWSSVEDFFAKAPGRLASTGAHLFDWVPGAFKWAINTVIGWWDSLSFGIPSIHIPGTNVNVGGGSIGVPQIPFFATGGVLPGGLTAAIGDAGPEVLKLPAGTQVMPNANAQSMLARGAAGMPASPPALEWIGPEGDELFTMIKRWIRVRYGNDSNSVQKALGQSF